MSNPIGCISPDATISDPPIRKQFIPIAPLSYAVADEDNVVIAFSMDLKEGFFVEITGIVCPFPLRL